jgi:hypothetical protein
MKFRQQRQDIPRGMEIAKNSGWNFCRTRRVSVEAKVSRQ